MSCAPTNSILTPSPSATPYYDCTFTVIDSQQPYRAPRVTPKPLIQGPQTAIVVGQSGEEIWTDEYGRVKCQFHWDRYGQADENSSCWIRVAQVWAGKKWGAIYTPRIGQEVIVEFLEGDPDRPIITGRVYNGNTMPPYELPAHKTLSGIKSSSSKSGGGFNEIRFEDKKGEEQIFVHAEKNQDIRVKNDRFEWIGQQRHLIVKNDKLERIEHNRHEIVDHDHLEEIGNDRNVKVSGKEALEVGASHSFTVKGDVIEVFKANHSESTTGNYYLKAAGVVIEATSGITLKCGGSNVVIDPSGVTVKGPLITLDASAFVNINSGPGSPAVPGQAGRAVAPAAPDKAMEADNADPGAVAAVKAEQRQKQAGKYGSVPVQPFKPADRTQAAAAAQSDQTDQHPEEQPVHWVEIELLDEEDNPVPGERYEIKLPDGSVKKGTLNEEGLARVDGIENPGECEITFPELDMESWEKN